jgi:hypothetical protein
LEKIISLIPSYTYNELYTESVIAELNKVSTTILFTTTNIDTTQASQVIVLDPSIEKDLVYETRKWVVENLDLDWDYVLYNEDDILITAQSIYNTISLYKTLPSNYVPGFIRYEYDEFDNKRFIDMHPAHAKQRGGYGIVKEIISNLNVWEPWNIHSGNWLFSKNDIKEMIAHDRFETYYNQFGMQYGNCDQLESAATSLYLNYTKVYPINIESVECHHLPNKYITMKSVAHGNPTLETLKTILC